MTAAVAGAAVQGRVQQDGETVTSGEDEFEGDLAHAALHL